MEDSCQARLAQRCPERLHVTFTGLSEPVNQARGVRERPWEKNRVFWGWH